MDKIEKIKSMIKNSENIVFFGGAGVSTESGLPDFRSSEGLYVNSNLINPEIILSHNFFIKNTKDFFDFYKKNMLPINIKANIVHKSLTKLEKQGKLKAIITQNIDGLHQLAQSENVIELHGSTLRNYCMECHTFYDINKVIESEDIPLCDKCGGIVKPDVVLYQESLDNNSIQQAINYISKADVLIVAGTSLSVYPAAGLIDYYSGNKLILINKDKTEADYKANLIINDYLGNIFTKLDI